MDRRAIWQRRIASAMIILVVAGGIGWWSTRQSAAETRLVQREVWVMCLRAIDGELPPPSGDFVTRSALQRLHELLDGVPADQVWLDTSGGEPPASHDVLVKVNGAPVLGLRVAVEADRIVIIGHWTPEAPPGTG